MPRIRPFTGLLYDPAVAGPFEDLTTPPYDTIGLVERDRYHRASPFNVIRLIRGRDEPGDDAERNRHTRAAAFLAAWRASGVLSATASPSVYPYEFRFPLGEALRTLRGVIAEVAIEPLGGSIVPHERTLPGPFRDRLSLLRASRANLSPVHAVSRGPSAELSAYLDDVTSTEPEREVRDAEDTRHRLWVRPDGGEVLAEAVRDEVLMIADGHHRYAVALAFKQEMDRAAGAGPWDWLMMLVVDAAAEQPPVLPIHRLVRDPVVPGPATDVVTGLTDLVATIRDDDRTYGLIRRRGRRLEHRVGALRGRPPTVRALHEEVLGDLPPGMRFVPDAVAAESSVRTGAAGAAYVLPPTRVERIRAVIAEGGTLPVKSTYFWPKPRTGMVIRPFDP